MALEQRGIEVLVPDSWAARELSGRIEPVTMNARQQHRHPGLQQLRERMRSGGARPVFGILKQQRNLRQFRCRGLQAVSTEWTLATTAFNLTRLFRHARSTS